MLDERDHSHDAAIFNLLRLAFDGDGEGDLVQSLRNDGDALIDWVWMDKGRVVGYLMFSAMQAPFKAAALAPVAVDMVYRQKGIADTMIRKAIKALVKAGYEGLFVLGDPDYYSRFGFSAAEAAGFTSPYKGPYFQFLPLATSIRTGRVSYAPAFSESLEA